VKFEFSKLNEKIVMTMIVNILMMEALNTSEMPINKTFPKTIVFIFASVRT
jgi:hypothetical protein